MHYTLADLMTDIIQNGVESGAGVVEIEVNETPNWGKGEFRFTIRDNGKGMSSEEIKLAQDPFFTDGVKHPQRKVGLGLPFLIQTAGQCGGAWEIKSEKGKGTEVSAWFDTANVDLPPLGDLSETFRTALLFQGPEEMVIRRNDEIVRGGIICQN
jgi:signal transduction histidine kinase